MAVVLDELMSSVALANDDSGAVRARAAHRPSKVTLMTANSSVIIHGPPQNGRCRWSGSIFAEIMAPSGNAMPILRLSSSCSSEKIR